VRTPIYDLQTIEARISCEVKPTSQLRPRLHAHTLSKQSSYQIQKPSVQNRASRGEQAAEVGGNEGDDEDEGEYVPNRHQDRVESADSAV
jgi:hypothetical protein